LADRVPREGLAAAVSTAAGGTTTVGILARELVAIARAGLVRLDGAAAPTVAMLAPVEEVAATGRTQADVILDTWQATGGEPTAAIAALAHPGLDGR
jgi:gamma-glutamylcysteine synthetase